MNTGALSTVGATVLSIKAGASTLKPHALMRLKCQLLAKKNTASPYSTTTTTQTNNSPVPLQHGPMPSFASYQPLNLSRASQLHNVHSEFHFRGPISHSSPSVRDTPFANFFSHTTSTLSTAAHNASLVPGPPNDTKSTAMSPAAMADAFLDMSEVQADLPKSPYEANPASPASSGQSEQDEDERFAQSPAWRPFGAVVAMTTSQIANHSAPNSAKSVESAMMSIPPPRSPPRTPARTPITGRTPQRSPPRSPSMSPRMYMSTSASPLFRGGNMVNMLTPMQTAMTPLQMSPLPSPKTSPKVSPKLSPRLPRHGGGGILTLSAALTAGAAMPFQGFSLSPRASSATPEPVDRAPWSRQPAVERSALKNGGQAHLSMEPEAPQPGQATSASTATPMQAQPEDEDDAATKVARLLVEAHARGLELDSLPVQLQVALLK